MKRRGASLPELKPEEVFATHPGIRWVGLATNRGKVIFSKMRDGVKSITPDSDDLLLLELRSQYITEMTQQVAHWAGPADYVAISYERFTELTIILKDEYVVLTVEKDVEAQEFPRIAGSVRELSN